jgi:hypothetical protein
MDVDVLTSGLEPAGRILLFHNCPAAELVDIVVVEGTIAETNTIIRSFACMPEGGVIDALVAVVTASSLAGTRDWPTTVIGGPPAAAARNAGVTGPPPLMNAELELRKAICACAALASAITAAATAKSRVFVPFMAFSCCSTCATTAVKECPG